MTRNSALTLALFLLVFSITDTNAQTTSFTYQGRLTDTSALANGTYDFQIALFDALSGGVQIGTTQTITGVTVTTGTFTVQLDFGAAAFPGADRFLEIRVKRAVDPTYTTLTPRQRVTATPYAIRALNAGAADTATNAAQLGGVAAANYLQTTGNGSGLTNLNASNITTGTLDNARLGIVPIANGGTGSATQNFVDLTTAQTIVGAKTFSNAVNTATQYNIGGNRVLSADTANNLFAGFSAGAATTSGINNSFFGRGAGQNNTTGASNSFVGTFAGFFNTTGFENSFFGRSAGQNNTTGNNNSFVGTNAGLSNTEGIENSFVGAFAGFNNTFGSFNSFFGRSAGQGNTTGQANSFFGRSAGLSNTTGGANSFFGERAGLNNTTGFNNSFFGREAGLNNTTGGSNSFFGTSAGQANTEGIQNSFFGANAGAANTIGGFNSFFGTSAGLSNTTGQANSFFGLQAGYSNTEGTNNSFVGVNAGFSNTTGNSNSFVGRDAGYSNTTGANNSFVGESAGRGNTESSNNSFFGKNAGLNTTGSGNAFFGRGAGSSNMTGTNNSFFGLSTGQGNTTGSNNTVIGSGAEVGSSNLSFATAIGSGAVVNTSDTVVLGRSGDTVNVPGTLTKAAGSFKIDHPLDPQNKTLSHSFVESPDMMNVYNGNITTDKNGEAIVTLPDYFEALNRDFRYQLTVIGTFAQAIVGEKIKDNQFKIRTDKPNVEVSWQVTGIRQDRFAEEHRIPTTEDKPVHEKGKCLYAPLCGDASINAAPRQAKP